MQALDDHDPSSVELWGTGGRASSGDAVGLLDERDADVLCSGRVRHRHEVRCPHSSGCAVAEDERCVRHFGRIQVGVRRAVGSVYLDRRHD